jgi:hypothetical protein
MTVRIQISNSSRLTQSVIAGHSRPKDGVASARLCPAIHLLRQMLLRRLMDARIKSGHDERAWFDISFAEHGFAISPRVLREFWLERPAL